jgi:putative DNA primase/helicase
MDLIQFARLHGLIIDAMPPAGRWQRLPTDDHPNKRNGAIKWMGDHAFVQNHATMVDVAIWQPDRDDQAPNIDHEAVRLSIEKQERMRANEQRLAARKAAWILHQTTLETHEYLIARGFPQVQGNVWRRTDPKTGGMVKLLVIPMRVDGELVGCQIISENGAKKFLTGQRTRDAVFCMDNKGPPILTEGYAKALAVREVMAALKQRYKILICFSAFNMATVARTLPAAFLIADRDSATVNAPEPGGMGLKVARESGRRYWISDIEGEDFDAYLKRVGVFRASQALRVAMAPT